MDVDTDVVAEEDVGAGCEPDRDAVLVVAADHVAGLRGRSADGVVVRLDSDLNAGARVAQVGGATDVSADVSVVLRGVRPDFVSGRFVGTAEITNNSASALPAPVSIVLDLTTGVRLANADGTTTTSPPIAATPARG